MSAQHLQCVNCGVTTRHNNSTLGIRHIQDEEILTVIQQWIAPQVVTSSHQICQACRNLAIHLDVTQPSPRPAGHRKVCVNCGRSLLSVKGHVLHTDSERETKIHTVILEWIKPKTISSEQPSICHSCWVRADRKARNFVCGPSESSTSLNQHTSTPQHTPVPHDAIELPDYVRAIETESRCFIKGCRKKQRNRIPDIKRIIMLNQYNFYVPQNNRFCNLHLNTEICDLLSETIDSCVNVFTADHIQDMLELKSQANP